MTPARSWHMRRHLPVKENGGLATVDLLAPGGSKAAWAAAVEAGADAVYVGLNKFSARTYADNFSLTELAGVIRESHRAGVKIYLAFNSLIKEGELGQAWRLLAACSELEPDALIIQDLGLNRLVASYFPHVPRHASTLTAVYSLPGLMTLVAAGFSRAVLARELALDEVASLAAHSPIGLEVFVHGALCFSFSGLCLMSSFLGGHSALRGGCTQPCRRLYQRGGRKEVFFSTTDLSAAPYLNELRRLPLASFKIEGRMKGPDYVSRVVRAYRMLLDAPDRDWVYALAEAENILAGAPGRRTTGGFLSSTGVGGPLAPLSVTTSGLKLGFLEPGPPGRGRVTLLERPVAVGDRLRLQLGIGEVGAAFNLKGIILNGEEVDEAPAGASVVLIVPALSGQKGVLFKVASGREERVFLASPLVRAVRGAVKNSSSMAHDFGSVPLELRVPRGVSARCLVRRPEFWLWLEKTEDLRDIGEFAAKKIILPLIPSNLRYFRRNRRHLKKEAARLVWSLPSLIFYRRQAELGQEVQDLAAAGFNDFMVANIGQINLLQRHVRDAVALKIWGDHHLGLLNHLAEAALADLGLVGATLSLEMDDETAGGFWSRPATLGRLVYLFGRPALFTSRFLLESRGNSPFISSKGEKFYLTREGEGTIISAERPVFLAPLLKKPPLPGGVGFILDLRREPHPTVRLRELKKILVGGGQSQGSAFNLKRSLF
ncbi:MAG: hypothetical protein AMR96_04935 [Candidatus Adiutrix intracellularis]|nr:MAG: hypothetical protein AMR96_04935 [Candidatus Adiutrix intracellularis]